MMNLAEIPHEPGCYLFRDGKGMILYIGKAKDLKKRISSYFRINDLDPKTRALVEKISSFDYIITATEKEALILENNLIKKNQPKYNINLKDAKRYAYILLTKEEFPRLLLARRKDLAGEYFGPFTSAEERDTILKFTRRLFQVRTCKKMPKRPCLRHHMGHCPAPCAGSISGKEYSAAIADAKKLLKGRNKELVKDLTKRMKEASREMDYERAKTLRNQISAIEGLNERSRMETVKCFDQDIINYSTRDSIVHISVFNAIKGVLSSRDEYEFDYSEDFLEEFMLQYYSEHKIPGEIIIPERLTIGMKEYLSEKKGGKVKVTVPSRGERRDLLDIVKKNIEASFRKEELALSDLREVLGLERIPNVIECFDISHTQGTNPTGSMVRFREGKPDKPGYRRFRIKTIEGIDDYAMMAEVVTRRYSRLKREGGEMPDLIVIDGGKGQLSAAFEVLRKLGLKIPVIALAKKMEEIYTPGLASPLKLPRKSTGLKLLQQVRDEAHRFAVSYHKLLRKKRVLGKNKV